MFHNPQHFGPYVLDAIWHLSLALVAATLLEVLPLPTDPTHRALAAGLLLGTITAFRLRLRSS